MAREIPRILLCEDNRMLRHAAEVMLRKAGYEVLVAVDGEEALTRARSDAPDLILLDVMMPKLQGFEVLARLKADPDTQHIPVIMLTSLGQKTDVHEALTGGAADYVVKSDLYLVELPAKIDAALQKAHA